MSTFSDFTKKIVSWVSKSQVLSQVKTTVFYFNMTRHAWYIRIPLSDQQVVQILKYLP
jgi:hypothetical protein